MAHPETNNLNIRIVDEKTTSVVGALVYNISNLMTKPDLQDMQQPYDLVNASLDSKLIMSMTLRILKYEGPEGVPEDDDEDEDINSLNRKIDRQESNMSGSGSSSLPSTPLKKQMSKESLQSSTNAGSDQVNPPGTVDEEIEEMICSKYSAENNLPPGLLHRHSSVSSSVGEYKLGRIQLTLRYSVQRQKLMVVVHKIA